MKEASFGSPLPAWRWTAAVPGSLHDVDFMVKDSKRFADSNGRSRETGR